MELISKQGPHLCNLWMFYNHFYREESEGHGCKLLTLVASAANHSCRANAVSLVIGNQVKLFALRDIKEGEEITIPYAAALNCTESIVKHEEITRMNREGRRKYILDKWNFVCECELCKEEEKAEKKAEDTCRVCKKENVKSKCAKCKKIYYCSRDCQIKDWKEHKLVCC